ncbi:MAG TPA: hypothetical protein VI997_10545 [Candidatus Thermoplasmatota archaeon]|nr:hypothetical protein [Candidatus Thermoplasmatota archaeon]
MPRPVELTYSRVFPYSVDVAYAWLTDYQDDDPSRTDRVVTRRSVVERHADRVILDADVTTIARWKGRVEVRLFPPDRWEARPVGSRSTVFTYRLEPHPAGARLTVIYTMGVRKPWKRAVALVTRPFIARRIARMWDGFAFAMERELGPAKRVAVARVG